MLKSSRLYAMEFTFDKSSNIKQTIYQKFRNSDGNTFSIIPQHVCYFISPQNCCFRRQKFKNTLLYQNEGGGGHSRKNIHILAPFYQISVTPPLSSVKTIKNLKSIKKSSMRDYIDRGLCIFPFQMLKTFSFSFNNWSKKFIRWGCFQISSGNNNRSLLYACEVIHLINLMFRSRVEYFSVQVLL